MKTNTRQPGTEPERLPAVACSAWLECVKLLETTAKKMNEMERNFCIGIPQSMSMVEWSQDRYALERAAKVIREKYKNVPSVESRQRANERISAHGNADTVSAAVTPELEPGECNHSWQSAEGSDRDSTDGKHSNDQAHTRRVNPKE